MTAAIPSDRQAQLPEHDVDAAVLGLLDSVTCMTRALDRVGTRSCAYDLLDVASTIEAALQPIRLVLRGRHGGEIPLHLRVELSILFRAATRAHELGSAGASVVPPSTEEDAQLRCDLCAWLACAEGLVTELDHSLEQAA